MNYIEEQIWNMQKYIAYTHYSCFFFFFLPRQRFVYSKLTHVMWLYILILISKRSRDTTTTTTKWRNVNETRKEIRGISTHCLNIIYISRFWILYSIKLFIINVTRWCLWCLRWWLWWRRALLLLLLLLVTHTYILIFSFLCYYDKNDILTKTNRNVLRLWQRKKRKKQKIISERTINASRRRIN
jgi:hypothetical protein